MPLEGELETGSNEIVSPTEIGAKRPFVNSKVNYNITKTIIEAPQNEDFKWSVLALYDPHIDSHKSNHDLFNVFCEQAVKCGAGIIIPGDFYDAMSGPGDKRGARAILRDPIGRKAYFDDLINEGVKLLHPYRHNLLMLGQGNHEESVLNYYGTDLTERTVGILNERGSSVANGHYAGWIDWKFVGTGKTNSHQTLRGYYHHGSGYSSDSKVKELCGEMSDIDVFFLGHWHKMEMKRWARKRRTTTGVYDDNQLVLHGPSLKDDTLEEGKLSRQGVYGSKGEGWSVSKGHRTKPMGAWWVDFTWSRYYRRYVFSAREAVA